MLDPKLLNFLFIRTGDELDFVCMKDILEIWEGEKKRKKDINEAIGSTFDVGLTNFLGTSQIPLQDITLDYARGLLVNVLIKPRL